MKKTTDFAEHLSTFLTMYLPGQKGFSSNTIASYRDAFKLVLEYAETVAQIRVEKLTLKHFSAEFVANFLSWLECERKCSRSTRNQRFSVIRSFAGYVKRRQPEYIAESQRILEIDLKKTPETEIPHLTPDAMQLLLAQPKADTCYGGRDIVLLTLMYDSGARVQEICDLCVGDVRLQQPYTLTLNGKGGRKRSVPLMCGTADLLKQYIACNKLDIPGKSSYSLFTNHQHSKLTRAGVAYILRKYWSAARKSNPGMPPKISPHILRHSKAMHMLQAGVNLVYIRDFLGHRHVTTTEVYARADSKMKRDAIEKAVLLPSSDLPDWIQDKPLMEMLTNLCR